MSNQITCGVDFSDSTEFVLSRASFMTSQINSLVMLIHCVEKDYTDFLNFIFETQEDLLNFQMNELENKLANLKKQFFSSEKNVKSKLVLGRISKTLVEESNAINSNLIIIAASNQSKMQRAFLGSNAIKISRDSDCSVLIVKNTAKQPYQRILVGVDFSSNIQALTSFIKSYTPNATLILVHCFEIPFEGALNHHVDASALEAFRQELRNEALQKLNMIIDQLDLDPLNVSTVVTQGHPAEILVQQAQAHNCDLIILNKNNQPLIDKWIFGSVTNEIMNLCTQDILVLIQKDI